MVGVMRTSHAFVAVVVACGGAANESPRTQADPHRAIALREWCGTVSEATCHAIGDRCMHSADVSSGCQETAQDSCLSGRDPGQTSGRTAEEMHACVALMDTTPCPNFLSEVARHQECQAR